jgi:hypothetical protein
MGVYCIMRIPHGKINQAVGIGLKLLVFFMVYRIMDYEDFIKTIQKKVYCQQQYDK